MVNSAVTRFDDPFQINRRQRVGALAVLFHDRARVSASPDYEGSATGREMLMEHLFSASSARLL